MNRYLFVAMSLSLLFLPPSVMAQGTLPSFEEVKLFVGYSVIPGQTPVQVPNYGAYGFEETTRHGWNVGVTGQVNRWVEIAFDASGHYTPVEIAYGGIDSSFPSRKKVGEASRYTFLAGPQFSFKSELPVSPFARALFGVSHYRLGINPGHEIIGFDPKATQTTAAFGAGGGVDLKLKSNVSIRLVQLDFLRLAGQEEPLAGYDYRKPNKMRWTFGLVFGF